MSQARPGVAHAQEPQHRPGLAASVCSQGATARRRALTMPATRLGTTSETERSLTCLRRKVSCLCSARVRSQRATAKGGTAAARQLQTAPGCEANDASSGDHRCVVAFDLVRSDSAEPRRQLRRAQQAQTDRPECHDDPVDEAPELTESRPPPRRNRPRPRPPSPPRQPHQPVRPNCHLLVTSRNPPKSPTQSPPDFHPSSVHPVPVPPTTHLPEPQPTPSTHPYLFMVWGWGRLR